MSQDTINLEDTVKVFKKNLKAFYFFIITGLTIGLICVFININYIEKKIVLSSTIKIKNPLLNYQVLDLFSLDTIEVDDKKVSVTSTQDKIKNYYLLSNEYLELVLYTIDFEKYDIDEKYGYKIKTERKGNEFTITISNVRNPDKVEKNLINMFNDFNTLIKQIILKNVKTQTTFFENFLAISKVNPDSEKLSILIKIRKESFNTFKDQDFEMFDMSSFKKTQAISNSRIMIVSLLISFSLFLMFVIIKR